MTTPTASRDIRPSCRLPAWRRLACAAALVLASCAAAATTAVTTPSSTPGSAPAPAPPSADDAALAEYERLGLALYRADRTAWLTTDQLFEQGLVDAETHQLVGVPGDPDGWVTSPTESPDIWRVAYVTLVDGKPQSFADGTVDYSAEPLASLRANATPRPLDGDEVAQRAIRQDAVRREWMSCSRAPYNTATLPDGRGGWFVYLMPPQQLEGVYPMGGFHRFRYDADGRFVEQYAHTRGCLDQNMKDAPAGEPAALFITHLTTPVPNEFHVFMNLSYGLPVFVATDRDSLWKVEHGHVRRVDTSELEGDAE